jgi:hypothetical protein
VYSLNTNTSASSFSLRTRKLLQELQNTSAVVAWYFFLLVIVILCKTTCSP